MILQAPGRLETAAVFALLIIFSALGIVLNLIVRIARRRIIFWSPDSNSGQQSERLKEWALVPAIHFGMTNGSDNTTAEHPYTSGQRRQGRLMPALPPFPVDAPRKVGRLRKHKAFCSNHLTAVPIPKPNHRWACPGVPQWHELCGGEGHG